VTAPAGWLVGRSAIVTGGAGGLGRAIARAMAREGAAVCVADIDRQGATRVADELTATGATALAVAFDVADPEAWETTLDAAERSLGPADTLCCTAGVELALDAPTTSAGEWSRTIDVNLGGVWHGCRGLIRRVRERAGTAVIINTATVNTSFVARGFAAHSASEGGVIGLTRALALDYARQGIRVNCVCPGYLDTGSIAQPDDVAEAVVFLASDQASFMTGAALVVDGGMSIRGPAG
jgi:meso-butanediol dehydrogenase/(S,S)-butanediol dehydrogenase/diacetyl reductase